MNKVSTKNKGFTLVEIIISVALIGILLIPVSSMVLTTVRTNKNGEIKQKATLVGQQVLEKLRAIEVKKDGATFSGITFNEKKADNIFVINDVDGYQVTTTLNLINTLDSAPKYDCQYNIGVRNEHPTIVSVVDPSQPAIVPIDISDNKIVMKIITSGNDRTININNGAITQTVVTKDASGNPSTNLSDKKDLNIVLNFSEYKLLDESKYVSDPIIIEIYNQDNKLINLCLQKKEDIKVNISTFIGSTKVYDNRPEDAIADKIGDMYDISVDVKKGNEVLFKGHAVKNIK